MGALRIPFFPYFLAMTINELALRPKSRKSKYNLSYRCILRPVIAIHFETSSRQLNICAHPILQSSLIRDCNRIDFFQSHSDHFLKALEVCRKSAKSDLKDLDISKSLTWDDVMAEYRNAFRKYEAKAHGWKGLPRKFGRVTGDNAPSVIPFLNFIPEGQYKSLFAGLFLIFAVSIISQETESSA